MKNIPVLLTSDVKQVGKKGEIVEVSDGFAKNFLLRKKLGELVTEGALKHYQEQKAAQQKKMDNLEAHAKTLKEDLEQNYVIQIHERTGKEGKLFGAVTSETLAEIIHREKKLDIDKKKIVLEEPIKTTGKHKVGIKLFHGIIATITVEVHGLEET
jgi:large subunit ribosomal protein L9